jgi:hypothetical protein
VQLVPALNGGIVEGQGEEIDDNNSRLTSEIMTVNLQGDAYARYVILEQIGTNPDS